MATSKSSVANFYKDAGIFLTGGTGFLGLAIIEKVLRSLPESGNLYLLMRAKKGKTVNERLQELTKNNVFEKLLETASPDVFKKLIPIEGDVGSDMLGMSDVDRATVIDNVHVVIHSAATLDFNETLRSTVDINLLGTRRVLDLCTEIKGLKSMVHVSSAYVNSWRTQADEILYPIPDMAEKVIDMVKTLNNDALQKETPKVLANHLNTYTFTKHLAEHEVKKYIDRFPCAIVRPSMIQPAWKEPIPGWTMSKNGPQGFLMGASKGVVRRLPADPKMVYDYIPVDSVVNQLLVSAKHVYQLNNHELNIYHATTSTCNPFRWEVVAQNVNSYINQFPLMSAVWYAHLKFLPSLFLFKIAAIFFHFIPAYILDTFVKLGGGRPILVRMHTNIWNSLNMLKPFIFNEWKFFNTKTLEMSDAQTDDDAKTFGFDVRSMDWDQYFFTMVQGVRRYLNKEHPRNLEKALQKNRWLLGAHVSLHFLLYVSGWTMIKWGFGLSWKETIFVLPIAYRLLSAI